MALALLISFVPNVGYCQWRPLLKQGDSMLRNILLWLLFNAGGIRGPWSMYYLAAITPDGTLDAVQASRALCYQCSLDLQAHPSSRVDNDLFLSWLYI